MFNPGEGGRESFGEGVCFSFLAYYINAWEVWALRNRNDLLFPPVINVVDIAN